MEIERLTQLESREENGEAECLDPSVKIMQKWFNYFSAATYCLPLFWMPHASADWLILSSNTAQGAVTVSTNAIATRVGSAGLRRDTDSSMSLLVFADRPEQVQLFHENKTYVRLAGVSSGSAGHISPQLFPGGEGRIGPYIAKVFAWTNGTDRGRIWAASTTQVIDPVFVGSFSSPISTNSGVFHSPGAMFDKDSIVVASEVTRAIPGYMPGLTGPISVPAQFTNLTFTMTSTLISMTPTNLPPTEFEIPKDYHEVPASALAQPDASLPPPLDPTRLGFKPPGANLEGLRKGFEQGGAVLTLPPVVGPQ